MVICGFNKQMHLHLSSFVWNEAQTPSWRGLSDRVYIRLECVSEGIYTCPVLSGMRPRPPPEEVWAIGFISISNAFQRAFTLVQFCLEWGPDPPLKRFERSGLYPSRMRFRGHLHLSSFVWNEAQTPSWRGLSDRVYIHLECVSEGIYTCPVSSGMRPRPPPEEVWAIGFISISNAFQRAFTLVQFRLEWGPDPPLKRFERSGLYPFTRIWSEKTHEVTRCKHPNVSCNVTRYTLRVGTSRHLTIRFTYESEDCNAIIRWLSMMHLMLFFLYRIFFLDVRLLGTFKANHSLWIITNILPASFIVKRKWKSFVFVVFQLLKRVYGNFLVAPEDGKPIGCCFHCYSYCKSFGLTVCCCCSLKGTIFHCSLTWMLFHPTKRSWSTRQASSRETASLPSSRSTLSSRRRVVRERNGPLSITGMTSLCKRHELTSGQ